MSNSSVPVLRLNPKDNVAIALTRLQVGDHFQLESVDLEVAEAIPFGHKVALRPIPMGDGVIKYGEIIGRATTPIEPGRHVHVHNVRSARLPGRMQA